METVQAIEDSFERGLGIRGVADVLRRIGAAYVHVWLEAIVAVERAIVAPRSPTLVPCRQ